MPKFKITDSVTGKAVTVSGETPPSHDEAEQIFKDAGLRNGPHAPNSFVDSVRSVPGGIAQGVTGLIGLPGTLSDLASRGLDAIANKITGAHIHTDHNRLSSQALDKVVSSPTGGYYQPQTTAGHYAETAASFAPTLLGGEASIGSKLMGRVLAPAAGAQAAGAAADATDVKSPYLRAALQTGGAVLGGGAVSGTRVLGTALLKGVPPEVDAVQQATKLAGLTGATPQTILANSVPNRGQLGAEALGPNGISMLATLGRRPGETAQALGNFLTTRSLSASSRIMDDFTAAAGIDPRAAQGNFDTILEAGQKRAEPLYKEAYKENTNIASPALDKILETPAGKTALADARTKMQNDMKLLGTPDVDLMDQAKEGGTQLPTAGAASGMKLRVYDYVKRSLDDQISSAYRSGNKNEGNIIKDLKNKLVSELDAADVTGKAGPNSLVPEGGKYAQAREAAGEYLGAQKAFEDGQNHILSPSISADEVTKYVAKLTPTAQEAYKGGIANKILIQAQNGRLTPRIVGTPAVQLKLSAILGPDKAEGFIKAAQQESDLAKSGSRMMPGTGSITSDILLNAGEQDSMGAVDAGMSGAKAVGHLLSGNPLAAAGHGISAFQKVGDFRRSAMMRPEVRNELGKLLMLPPEELANKLQLSQQAMPKQIPQNTLGRLLREGR